MVIFYFRWSKIGAEWQFSNAINYLCFSASTNQEYQNWNEIYISIDFWKQLCLWVQRWCWPRAVPPCTLSTPSKQGGSQGAASLAAWAPSLPLLPAQREARRDQPARDVPVSCHWWFQKPKQQKLGERNSPSSWGSVFTLEPGWPQHRQCRRVCRVGGLRNDFQMEHLPLHLGSSHCHPTC